MKKTIAIGATLALVYSLSANAAEMIRYEYKYYQSGKKLPQNQEQNYSDGRNDRPERKATSQPVKFESHPMNNHNGLFKDR